MGIILPLASSPFADITNVHTLYTEIAYELDVTAASPLARIFESNSTDLAAMWQEFKATVLAGTIPRWVKEMAGVSVALTIGSAPVQQLFMHSLEAQGIHPIWLDELRMLQLDPFLLPDDIQAVVMYARAAARKGCADDNDADMLREYGWSDDEVSEAVAAINLCIRACLYTTHRAMTFAPTQLTARAG